MILRLWQCWRVLATGFCFSMFGIGGLLITLIAVPLLRLFVRSPITRKRYAQRLVSKSFYAFIALMRGVGVVSWQVQNRERLNQPGHLIITNHPTIIDVVMLIALMPEVDCIVGEQYHQNPFTGGPIRAAGYLSNVAGPELISQCQDSLQQGQRLLVFPEGTRTVPGKPLNLRRGAANIALHAGVDIVPVTILVSESTLTKSDRWYHVPKRKLRVRISVDEPISIQPYLQEDDNLSLAARKLTRDLRSYYVAKLTAAKQLPENDHSRENRRFLP